MPDAPLVAVTDHALERYAQRVPRRSGALDRRAELAGRVARAWAAGRVEPGPRGSVHVRDLDRPGLVFVCRHDRPRGELVVVTVWEVGEDAAVPRAFTDALEPRRGRAASVDVAVIGAGIVGCAAAAFLAETGLRVQVFERDAVAGESGGASRRNSGVVQHPLDPDLVALHEASLEEYRALGLVGEEPAGLIVLAAPGVAPPAFPAFPELAPEPLDAAALRALEPALAPGLTGVRLATGHSVGPAAATDAFARRARAAGARFSFGRAARLVVERDRVVGVEAGTRRTAAAQVLVAAGAWTPPVVDPSGGWRPIVPVWGATTALRLPDPPRHVLEETGVEAVAAGASPAVFSLVTTRDGVSVLGSTFDRERPDADAAVPDLLTRGARFVPALAEARVDTARACARPQSADGRPLLGAVPGIAGLFVAAGHGPWGISLGPGSARLVADAMLASAAVPPALAAERVGAPPAQVVDSS